MNTVDLIAKKRDGGTLTSQEIEYMVMGYTKGDIPDYQMSAFLMAVLLRGMNKEETIELTRIMKESGDVVDLSSINGIKVDKHSTGGVGDKTTLIVAPMAAACGVPIAKMSGRGLGFTGGTIDKLESIPGFQTSISEENFYKQVNEKGIAVIGQTGHIAPADKKIYALRDVTATVENLSLITSSIMSKKLAAGSDAILLDVKCGSGAFMKTEEDAAKLAKLMVEIGCADGKNTMAIITDMSQPLGHAVGNSLEVQEAIQVLKGQGPADIALLAEKLAGAMVFLGGKAETMEEGILKAQKTIEDGSALAKFRDLVDGQGGNPDVTEDFGLLPQSEIALTVDAPEDGYIASVDAMTIGLASQHTGAGRQTKDDVIDLAAGIIVPVKVGDFVHKGDALCTLYGNDESKLQAAVQEAAKAFALSHTKVDPIPLIKRVITNESE